LTPSRLVLALAALLVPAGLAAQEPSPAPPHVESQELTPAPVAPSVAAELDPMRALEAVAEQRYLEGNLAEAELLYRQIAAKQVELAKPVDRRVQTLILIAWLDHLLARPAEAREALAQALYLQPDYAFQAQNYTQPFVDLYQQGLAAARARRRSEAADAIRSAVERLSRGIPAEARQLLQRALELEPTHPDALYNLALTDMMQNQPEPAIAGFERLLALVAGGGVQASAELQSKSLNNLGVLYYNKAYYEDAARSLQRALELTPSDQRAWDNLGLALRRQGKLAAATDAFRRAFDLVPGDEVVAGHLALAYIDTERWVDARALLTAASQKHPESPTLWLELGLAERGLGNTAGAVTAFRRVLEIDPQNRSAQADRAAVFLALMYHENGQPEEAATAARQALAWKPGDIEALTYLGLSQQALGDLEAARDSLDRAAKLDPRRAELANNLGTIYFEMGDLDKAEQAFQQALGIKADFAAAAANLESVRKRRAELAAAPPANTAGAGGRPRSLGAKFSAANFPAIGIKGLLVESVTTNGAAAAAGLRKGDLVLLLDGREVTSPEQLQTYVTSGTRATTLTLDLLRDSRPLRVTVRIR
jgi:tetratricopeptide (TPR) repeat protein